MANRDQTYRCPHCARDTAPMFVAPTSDLRACDRCHYVAPADGAGQLRAGWLTVLTFTAVHLVQLPKRLRPECGYLLEVRQRSTRGGTNGVSFTVRLGSPSPEGGNWRSLFRTSHKAVRAWQPMQPLSYPMSSRFY